MNAIPATVLVVDDEPQMRKFLRAALASHSYRVLEASSVSEALMLTTSHRPDLLLLDLGLSDGDGLSLVEQIRGWSKVPIIVISARGREEDKVTALDAGADDYLTKPFGANELMARIRVGLRRTSSDADETDAVQRIGSIVIDRARRVVVRDGVELKLTPIEYRLLSFLAVHLDRVITHRQILKEIWGPNAQSHTHYLRVYAGQLRRKIESDPARPTLLVTEPGVGYRLRSQS